MTLVPRQDVFDTYWKFAAERNQIFMRRVQGEQAPWTEDPILRDHKFCNTFRAADRVSQDLIRVAYEPAPSRADQVFRIVAYRTFSNIHAWRRIVEGLSHQPTLADLDSGAFGHAVDKAKETGTLYTSAFILPPIPDMGVGSEKHKQHVAMWKHQFIALEKADRIVNSQSLEHVYMILHSFPGYGDFLAYQMAVDLNYSTAIDYSENDFTVPGPGAVRGMQKVFKSTDDTTPADVIQYMVGSQDEHFERLGLDWQGLWGRPLHAIDCQGLFCETDKYSRVAFPELQSNRANIKAKFKSPDPESLTLFFPPKWNLNDRLPTGPVLGSNVEPGVTLEAFA